MEGNLAPLPARQLAILTKQFHFIANANYYQKTVLEGQLPGKQKEFDRFQLLINNTVESVVSTFL